MDIDKMINEMTLEEKAGLCSGKDFWHTKAVERLGIPAMMMCDGPHGLRKQKDKGDHLGINDSIQAVCFPTASALAASFDVELLEGLGEILGEECQAEDVAMLLGPGLNMKRSPLCGRNFEYFSEDPYLAGKLGAAYVKGLQSKGTAACVKHFAANNQETRRQSGDSVIDERTLHEIYLPVFEAAVKEGKTRSVMCSYNKVNGTFASESKELLTDILRDEWGFDGFVVTDWGAGKDRVKGIKAGVDLEMPGGCTGSDAKIVEAVKDGSLDEAELDRTVRRMLQFAADYQEMPKTGSLDFSKGHAKAVEFAAESAVLLKNEDSILPLGKDTKIAVIGEFAEKPRYQGSGSSHINTCEVPGALECFGKEILDSGMIQYAKGYDKKSTKMSTETDKQLAAEAVSAAEQADAAVIFAGLTDFYETEGADRENMDIPENQNYLIEEVIKVQPKTIVVLHGGSPVSLPWKDKVPAILCMYLGGEGTGEAAVSLLYGKKNPSGKLAETWPLKLEDNPSFLNFPGESGTVEYHEGIYIGYRYYDKKKMEVAFPFGHGLSYTQFAYRDLRLSCNQMKDTDTAEISVKVKNTGSCAGKEIVQLYVQDPVSSVRRPERELKGFKKISLLPGEEKEVCFMLDKRSFAYYEPKIHDWFVESGEFIISVGTSSRDLCLGGSIQVEGTTEIPMVYTSESTVGDLMKTEKGRAVLAQMRQGRTEEESSKNTVGLGEGGERMREKMMAEMPLGGIVSFGRMTEEQLDGLLKTLNADNGTSVQGTC